MIRIVVERTIEAPRGLVFDVISDVRRFSEALPHLVRYELLTDGEPRVGSRFVETRVMNGQEMSTELEITEYVANERVRMVADSHGTVWDTAWDFRDAGDAVHMVLTMDAHPRKMKGKLLVRLFKGMIKKGVARDMDLVKAHCEEASR